jgi:anti-anti-sigma regulatory factor
LSVDVLAGCIGVDGELDRLSVHHLADALSALRSSPSPVWTLDLQELTFCDAEGLRALHRAVVLAHSYGRGAHLTRVPSLVADLLTLLSHEPEEVPARPPLRKAAAL